MDDRLRRFRRLARTAAFGVAAGLVAVFGLSVAAGWPLREASAVGFSLAALVFGFGLTTWATAVLLGESIGRVVEATDSASDWTEAGARQAMSHLSALGGGGMAGAVVATVLLRLAGF
jgi:hypothetical protein